MKFSLQKEDLKYQNTEEDLVQPAITLKKEMVSLETEFNPWDYVRVVNVRGEPEYMATRDEKVVPIHRGNPILGNKHPMTTKSMKERDRVIIAFNHDLEKDLAIQGPMWKALQELAKDIVDNKQKIALECWCLPCQCHGLKLVPVIVNMVNDILNPQKENRKRIKNC